ASRPETVGAGAASLVGRAAKRLRGSPTGGGRTTLPPSGGSGSAASGRMITGTDTETSSSDSADPSAVFTTLRAGGAAGDTAGSRSGPAALLVPAALSIGGMLVNATSGGIDTETDTLLAATAAAVAVVLPVGGALPFASARPSVAGAYRPE